MIRKFLTHVLPGVLKPLRVLWNEVIGFVFLALAAWTIPSTLRTAREFDGDAAGFLKLLLGATFGLLMAGFGVFSFFRARKISRS
jgi:hypothetical protein